MWLDSTQKNLRDFSVGMAVAGQLHILEVLRMNFCPPCHGTNTEVPMDFPPGPSAGPHPALLLCRLYVDISQHSVTSETWQTPASSRMCPTDMEQWFSAKEDSHTPPLQPQTSGDVWRCFGCHNCGLCYSTSYSAHHP